MENIKAKIIEAKKIGIDYAQGFKDKPWRFYLAGSKFVSRMK